MQELIETHYKENFDRLSKQWGRRFDNPHIGQDVVQEAYTRAIRYSGSYNPDLPFDNWFGRIIHNAYKDIQKEEQGHSHEEIDEFSLAGVDNHHEVDRLIDQIIGKISEEKPAHQEVLTLCFVNNLTPREISQITGINHRMTRKIVSDYRTKIRRMLN